MRYNYICNLDYIKKGVRIFMKKWNTPSVEELSIDATAHDNWLGHCWDGAWESGGPQNTDDISQCKSYGHDHEKAPVDALS